MSYRVHPEWCKVHGLSSTDGKLDTSYLRYQPQGSNLFYTGKPPGFSTMEKTTQIELDLKFYNRGVLTLKFRE